MKFRSHIHKTITETVIVDANDPREAIAKIREWLPRFTCDEVIELIPGEDGKPEEGHTHEAVAGCENCDTIIMDGEKYVTTDDDVILCDACYRAACEAHGIPL